MSKFSKTDWDEAIARDVSNVTKMNGMFGNAEAFNQDIGNWDVGNVTGMFGMNAMFYNASAFNQDLTNWCVSYWKTIPHFFSTNSALIPENHPVWGTCP